jgi:hypothetical protein
VKLCPGIAVVFSALFLNIYCGYRLKLRKKAGSITTVKA